MAATVRGLRSDNDHFHERCAAATVNPLGGATIRFLDCLWNRPAVAGGSWRPLMWVLLLVPFIGLLWVPFYNFTEPSLFGFPFFYWYQFAWVPITSVLIWLVYRSLPHDEAQ